jgi:hypothetical protein
VPSHHGVGWDDDQGGAPFRPCLGEEDPKESVPRAEFWTLDGARQRGQLLTEREILERDRPVSAADQSDRSEDIRDPAVPGTTKSTGGTCDLVLAKHR